MADFPIPPRYSFRVNLKSPEETSRSNEKSSKQKKISTKERYNQYRRRLQQDNDAYTKFKKTDALKKRIFRKNLVGEQLETYNEKAKMRMRAYRLRQKEKGVVEKPATRKSIAKLREYWREKKKQHRSKMTPEAKDREREKRRQRYKSSKLPVEPKDKTPQKSNYIPRNPEKFAEIIQNAVQTATPRKKTALFKTGLFDSAKKNETLKNETNAKIVARVKRALNNLKRQKTKVGRSHYQLLTRSIVGKYAVEHSLRKALDMKWEHWIRMSEIEKNDGPENSKRIDALADETVQHIERYYEYESVTLPMKKTVSGKTLKQKRVLTETLPQVHKRFLQDNPKLKVSLGHFRKLRPKEVLTVHKQKFATCLCEYCLNVQFKIDVINRAMKTHKLDCTIESKFHAVNISLCEKKRSIP